MRKEEKVETGPEASEDALPGALDAKARAALLLVAGVEDVQWIGKEVGMHPDEVLGVTREERTKRLGQVVRGLLRPGASMSYRGILDSVARCGVLPSGEVASATLQVKAATELFERDEPKAVSVARALEAGKEDDGGLRVSVSEDALKAIAEAASAAARLAEAGGLNAVPRGVEHGADVGEAARRGEEKVIEVEGVEVGSNRA